VEKTTLNSGTPPFQTTKTFFDFLQLNYSRLLASSDSLQSLHMLLPQLSKILIQLFMPRVQDEHLET
jgi:hypothetical protein